MERHNLHATHGINKGKFIKKRKLDWRENVLEAKRRKLSRDEGPPPVVTGRRIVEIEQLAAELWCNDCDLPLSMRNIVDETRIGLASCLKVQCTKCNSYYRVRTGKSSRSEQCRPVYDVNLKAAIGILDAGIGGRQLNTLLTSFDIPIMYQSILKRQERIVGPAIEKVAEDTCRESIQLEKTKRLESDSTASVDNIDEGDCVATDKSVGLTVSYDAGWQKRGTGHAYNSLSGHGCLIGFETGKILSYATRSKRCSRCEHGEAASTHDCRKNFSESAKRMESDMATQLMTKNPWLSDENTHVSVLIADDDASTIAAVRRESTHPIEKWSDLNHAKKSLTSSLYALKLPRRTIEYFAQCFTAALKQNKGDAPKVESALKNVVPHAFGDHTGCGDWCKNRSSKEHFNARLPKGEPLSDPQLRLSLTQLFSKFANNAQKLAPCASSQANEAFNHTVASKHPKSQHYAASESLDFRVAAAVCQKNLGTRYIEKVCQKLSLSLSDLSIKHREQVDAEGRTRREKTKTVEYKRQRLLTKRNRTSKNSADSNKEGISYQSASGYEGVSELLKDTPSQDSVHVNLEHTAVVVFDLETSGLGYTAEICQIAALYNDRKFNAHMVPSKGITPQASAVTGLQVVSGEMFLNDERVDTVPARLALLQFIEFLRSIESDVLLVAHNGFRFDVPIILRHIIKNGLLSEFMSAVKGFGDTMITFRNCLEDRRKAKKKFTQGALAADFLDESATVGAHDARNDVETLHKLIEAIGVDAESLKKYGKSVTAILKAQELSAVHATHKVHLKVLKPRVSAGMIDKLVNAGITVEILEKAFMSGQDEAIKMLLAEDVGGRPRVTKNTKVIQSVIEQMRMLTKENATRN